MSLHQTYPANTRVDWQTPDNVLELVRKLGPIWLDPCTGGDNPTGAQGFYTERDNGLTCSWSAEPIGGFKTGLRYVNPPYGRGIDRWIEKCLAESEREPDADIILLVPANTDSRWYDRAALSADARCEVRGRLRFKGATQSAMFGSAVFYFGPRPHAFCEAFAALGRCYARSQGRRKRGCGMSGRSEEAECAHCGMPIGFLGPGEGCPAKSNGHPCDPGQGDELDGDDESEAMT